MITDPINALDLSSQIRVKALSGKSFWNAIAFWLFLVLTTFFLILSILFGLDTLSAIFRLGPEFQRKTIGDLDALPAWMDSAIDRFDSLRGVLFETPAAWGVLFVVIGIMFVANYTRFPRPTGRLLRDNDKARSVVERLLSQFRYFKDIVVLERDGDKANNSFLAARRMFFAPKGQVSRIEKGKTSVTQQTTLRFFMAHELSHALTKDNMANSVFLVTVSIYSFAFLAVFLPFLAAMVMIITPMPSAVLLYVLVSLSLYTGLCFCIAASFYGVLVSYVKAREFFADEIAYACVDGVQDPYSRGEGLARPDSLSAMSLNISGYERHLHKSGHSLHARNLLVFARFTCLLLQRNGSG